MALTTNNVYSPYDPIWYAQEALIQLEKALGLAARVHRGYDNRPQNIGSVIQIRRPGVFTAANAPAAASALQPSIVQVTLNKWKEVKFVITDQELAYTGEAIINDHIRPAAYAIADQIDQDLVALTPSVVNATAKSGGTNGAMDIADVLAARKALFDAKCPMDPGFLHAMLHGAAEADMLGLAQFTQYNTAGTAGVDSLMRGSMGTRYGFEFFSNQNYYTHTPGTAADTAAALNGNHALGATTLSITAYEASGTIKTGDLITITGDTTGSYAVTADKTASGGAITDLTIEPGLRVASLGNAVVTATLVGGSGGGAHPQPLFFHRNYACLAMAPLTTLPRELGAMVETVTDPITGLSLRSRMYYDGANSAVYVAIDVLYGVKILDGRLACRVPYLA